MQLAKCGSFPHCIFLMSHLDLCPHQSHGPDAHASNSVFLHCVFLLLCGLILLIFIMKAKQIRFMFREL